MSLKKIFLIIIVALIAVGGFSCGNRVDSSKATDESTEMIISIAKGIEIVPGDGYTMVKVKNPWKQGALLQTYLLVPRGASMPENMPKGTIVRTPLQNAVVYSSVHGNVIKELGSMASIKGVCDANYFNMAEVQNGLSDGTIQNIGNSASPSVEKLVEMSPEVIILSPFQNAGYGALTNLGVPIIECADYMENTPLGRAEWIKFFGFLYDKQALADSIFDATVKQYNEIRLLVATTSTRPKILSELMYSGVWYVPGGDSYMARMFEDAGAIYPWGSDTSTGSLTLDFAQVLDKAGDADIWLIKPMAEMSYSDIEAENHLYAKFKAFKEQRVFQCVTVKNTLFQDFPFHPEVLLRDYVAIFHPELSSVGAPKYYQPVNK